MQFVYPAFLFALAAVAVPIIIHLFHFRRYKKIIFSDVRFLKQVQEQNKSKQKLKDLLVLLARVLAIIFLVLAFAQPFIPAQHSTVVKGQKAISIFIDNSFSMNNEGPEGNLLETAKNKARAIIRAFGNDDEFQILTHDFEGKHQRLVNQSDALNLVDELKISPASVTLSAIIGRQKQALEKSGDKTRMQYIISDFQQQMCEPEPTASDSNLSLNLVPVSINEQRNSTVDSVWLASPVIQVNQSLVIRTRIRNTGKEPVENIAVTLKMNNEQKGLQHINCDPGGYVDVSFSFTPTSNKGYQGEISITDHPITFDDKLYFSFTPVASYEILSINGNQPNPYISSLFASDPVYTFRETNQNQLNYTLFSHQQLIILNNPQAISSGLSLELKKYIEQGGQLLCFPPTDKNVIPSLNVLLNDLSLPTYGSSLKQQVSVNELNLQDALFKNVFEKLPKNMDLPKVSEFYAMQRNSNTRGKSLMTLNNGQPFMWQSAYKKGNIVLMATPLEDNWSTFAKHSIYVPIMLKLGTGKPQSEKLYFTIGRQQWIPLTQQTGADKLVRFGNKETALSIQTAQHDGKTSIYLDYPLTSAGIYSVKPTENTTAEQPVAMNFDRKESDTRIWPGEGMESFLSHWPNARISSEDTAVLQHTISNQLNGTPFWRYCVWLALVFVLIEILLLRLLK
jgi:hypothetical protein